MLVGLTPVPDQGPPLRRLLRALERLLRVICTKGLGLRNPFIAVQKEAGLSCESFLQKGEAFACVGKGPNLKDVKDPWDSIDPKGPEHTRR